MTNLKLRYPFFLFVLLLLCTNMLAQSTFPAETWSKAANISSVLPDKTYEVSGLYWNDSKKQLYAVCDNGKLLILNYNNVSNTFSLMSKISDMGAPEGIMQVENGSNEIYTIDESDYEIRKYSLSANYAKATLSNTWNLLSSPSPMTDTGNKGPEGIVFVPDWYLHQAGFVSAATGLPYQSVKGMNGLIFIAHQDEGYVWVFDVNPNVSNDMIFVGKYQTNRNESCDLSFDPSTGLMYILHNTGSNYLEVSNLTASLVGEKYKLNTVVEYYVPNPSSGNTNVEGFALTPKFSDNALVSAWFCRDTSSSSESLDCLRWFTSFNSPGENILKSGIANYIVNDGEIDISFVHNCLTIQSPNGKMSSVDICIYSLKGEIINYYTNISLPFTKKMEAKSIQIVSILKNGKTLAISKI